MPTPAAPLPVPPPATLPVQRSAGAQGSGGAVARTGAVSARRDTAGKPAAGAAPALGRPVRSAPSASPAASPARIQVQRRTPPSGAVHAAAGGGDGRTRPVSGGFDPRQLSDGQVEALADRLSASLARRLRFDARKLTEPQTDELVRRLFGPLARLLRTEFRLDRERIGRQRDARR